MLRPASQAGPMHEYTVVGKLVNAALLSLMRRVWIFAALPSSWVNSSAPLVCNCRHDRIIRQAGRVGLPGRDRWRRRYWATLYLFIYTSRLLVSVFLYSCLIQACMLTGHPATYHTSHHRPRPNLAVRVDRVSRQPTSMQPGTFCYRWLSSA